MAETMVVFTEDEVASLNAYQEAGVMHLFTCPNCPTDLHAETTGWVCPGCGYRQNWAHGWMKDWEWLRLAIPGLHTLTEEQLHKREELFARDRHHVAEPSGEKGG